MSTEQAVRVKAIRDRAWHFLEPSIAQEAGLTLAELQQVIGGTVSLSEQQLVIFERRMGLK